MSKKPKRSNLKPPGKCVFCGNGDLTKEHIWPNWLSNYIPKYPVSHNAHALFTSRIVQNKTVALQNIRHGLLHRQGAPHVQKLRIVCGICNNGWMSRVVESAKPALADLVLGRWPILTPDTTAKLSAWAALFTIVNEYTDINTAAIPEEHKKQLMHTLTVPNGWAIFCNNYAGTHSSGADWHKALVRNAEKNQYSKAYFTQTTTFIIGSCIFHAISFKKELGINASSYGKSLGFARIWPPKNKSVLEFLNLALTENKCVLKPETIADDASYVRASTYYWNQVGIKTDPLATEFVTRGMASGILTEKRPKPPGK